MKTPPNKTAFESAPSKRNFTAQDLFPETLPPVNAALWPTAGTRDAEALDALMTGSQNQADYSEGWRLAAYVNSLKNDGWAIISRAIIKHGCRRQIAEYRLDRSDPSTAATLAMRLGVDRKL